MSHVEYSNNFSMEFGFMGTISKHHFLENISHLYLARQLYKKITWDYMFVFALELGRVWFWAKNFFLFTVPFLLFMQGGHKRQPSWTSLALICYRYYLIMNKSKSFFCSNLYAPYPFHVNFNHRSKYYRSSVNPTCFKLQFMCLNWFQVWWSWSWRHQLWMFVMYINREPTFRLGRNAETECMQCRSCTWSDFEIAILLRQSLRFSLH